MKHRRLPHGWRKNLKFETEHLTLCKRHKGDAGTYAELRAYRVKWANEERASGARDPFGRLL